MNIDRQREHELLDAQPYKLHTRSSNMRFAHALFRRHGYRTVTATYDDAVNCLLCGESGRCPGVHLVPRTYNTERKMT